MKTYTKEWFMDALIRAIRTFAQTALGFLTIGLAFDEVEWLKVLSVAGVSAIYSILTSMVTGLPESSMDGVLLIDDHGETTKWLLQVDTLPEEVGKKSSIRLKVNSDASFASEEE